MDYDKEHWANTQIKEVTLSWVSNVKLSNVNVNVKLQRSEKLSSFKWWNNQFVGEGNPIPTNEKYYRYLGYHGNLLLILLFFYKEILSI